ncbi:DUF4232 domain-containing protein [Streptodolium elevatio]|uniref:DUF4232 domain-containing protein n=1 Tax=Streptodolium elevatio TaxID=3157996 RepID=A0ABV3DEV3_9ACTN
MSARTSRIRLFAATTAALAAFGLTACSSGDDEARAGASSPAPSAPAQTGGSGTGGATASPTQSGAGTSGSGTGSAGTGAGTGSSATQGAKSSGTTGGSGGSNGTGGSGGSGNSNGTGGAASGGSNGGNASGGSDSVPKLQPCGGTNTKMTATVVARPLNHLLLTVTNTGSKNCDLVGYPAARFGEAQSVPPVDDTTKPQAVISLAPGESGYAGVRLSAGDGSGDNGYTTSTLEIPFEDGSVANPSLPAAGVYVDTTLQVTYWQQTLDMALN